MISCYSLSISEFNLSALNDLPDFELNVQTQQPSHTLQQQVPAAAVVLSNTSSIQQQAPAAVVLSNTNSIQPQAPATVVLTNSNASIQEQHSYLSGLLTSPPNGPVQRPVQATGYNTSPRLVYPPQQRLANPRQNHSITPQNLQQQLELPPAQQQQNNVVLPVSMTVVYIQVVYRRQYAFNVTVDYKQ